MPDRTPFADEPSPEEPTPGESRLAGMPVRWLVVGTLVAVILAVAAGALAAVTIGGEDDDAADAGGGARLELEATDVVGRPIAAAYTGFDGEVRNTAGYLGRPLVLNFFAEWCAPCIAEMPAFEEVHQELGDEVAFLGLDLEESVQSARSIVERTGVTYDVGRDADGSVFTTVGGTAMPTTVFIDDAGTIVETHSGALTADELRALIDEHLS